jgi:hypothetical protein
MFFFEKKNQKTFMSCCAGVASCTAAHVARLDIDEWRFGYPFHVGVRATPHRYQLKFLPRISRFCGRFARVWAVASRRDGRHAASFN